MPRFVILRHDGPRGLHFDLMLEAADVMKTWALPEQPGPDATMSCDALEDHRMAFLEYQGPISGGRGSVTRWDRGTYTLQSQSDAEWIAELSGEKLSGTATLRQEPDSPSRWRFSFTASG
jgi:hypothetical protein